MAGLFAADIVAEFAHSLEHVAIADGGAFAFHVSSRFYRFAPLLGDLARAKDSREPVVLVRGLDRLVTPEDGPGAAALVRARSEDLFQ